jgi:hypothetical protein
MGPLARIHRKYLLSAAQAMWDSMLWWPQHPSVAVGCLQDVSLALLRQPIHLTLYSPDQWKAEA